MSVDNVTTDSGFSSSVSDCAPIFTPELLAKNDPLAKTHRKNSLKKKLTSQMKHNRVTSSADSVVVKSAENLNHVFVTDEENSSGSADSPDPKSAENFFADHSLSSSLESVGLLSHHGKSFSSNEEDKKEAAKVLRTPMVTLNSGAKSSGATTPSIARSAAAGLNEVTPTKNATDTGHTAVTPGGLRGKKRFPIPAPLALPEDSTSQCDSLSAWELSALRGRKISAPPPRNFVLNDVAALATDSSGPPSPSQTPKKRLLGKFVKARLPKLPPQLRVLKKKQSCPSLLENFNNSDLPWGAVEPPAQKELQTIRNPIQPVVIRVDREPPRSAKGKCRFFFPSTEEETENLLSSGTISTNMPPTDDAYLGDALGAGPRRTLTPPSTRAASKSHSCPSIANTPANGGMRYKLLKEGQIQVCKLNHPKSLVGKLSSSKLLRRWEIHQVVMDKVGIRSTTPTGIMEHPIKYAQMDDVHVFAQLDSNEKFCIRLFVNDGSILLQTNQSYARNQWLHSIQWRRSIMRYKRLFEATNRPEIILKELKGLVEHSVDAPIQDDAVYLEPVQMACKIMKDIYDGKLPNTLIEPVILCVSPLLETVSAVAEICPWLSKYCHECPRSRIISDVFVNVVHETLKKNMDYGKFPSARSFVQCIFLALSAQNGGLQRVRDFVHRVHGLPSACPHPRVLPNLVSACLAAVHVLFDPSGSVGLSVLSALSQNEDSSLPSTSNDCVSMTNEGQTSEKLECFCSALDAVSEFDDWRHSLASMLQPLPFPESAFQNEIFGKYQKRILHRFTQDSHCDVHTAVLGIRDGKEGWFHMYCPGGPACVDDGELFTEMLEKLLHCCCKRKSFLQSLNGMLGPLQLLALREKESAMEALAYMLEFEVVEGEDLKVQMITALQSTVSGKKHYNDLCDRQHALKELQQKGGPRKLTLPSRSTDADLAVLLSSGSFGNLEWLSLAFTNVTSNCADYLIKLPSLRYLNLWSTQFGDLGVQMISEHLHKLQVLNLCETPVTDKGLISLRTLKNLRKLNLNSTSLSAETFQKLRDQLPALQEVDLRYTEAWCAEEPLSP